MGDNSNSVKPNPEYDQLLKDGYFNRGAAPADKDLLKIAEQQEGVAAKLGRAVNELMGDKIDVVAAVTAEMKKSHGGTSDDVHMLPPPRTPADVSKLAEISELTGGGEHGVPAQKRASQQR